MSGDEHHRDWCSYSEQEADELEMRDQQPLSVNEEISEKTSSDSKESPGCVDGTNSIPGEYERDGVGITSISGLNFSPDSVRF